MTKKITRDLVSEIKGLIASDTFHTASFADLCTSLKIFNKDKPLLRKALDELLVSGVLVYSKRTFRVNDRAKSLSASSSSSEKKSSSLIEGVLDATPLSRNMSFAFVKTPKEDFFVGAEDTLNAYHGDKVMIEVNQRRGKRTYAVIRSIVERANSALAGDIKISNQGSVFICSNPKIFSWFSVSNPNPDYDGMKVILEVSNWGNRQMGKNPVGKVIEVLGKSGNPEIEILALIRQFGLPLDFPEIVMAEATNVQEEISAIEIAKRRDLRELHTYTIDPISAKDFDDAISIVETDKGYRLWVHIADVAHYVKTDSALFAEAVARGNSYYFPKRVLPMLPEKLSNKVCSLRPDEDKLCLTVYSEFDKRGNILKQDVFESIIRSQIRLCYEEVDAYFDGSSGELDDCTKIALDISKQLSLILSKKRRDAGYIFFDLPDISYLYNEEGFISSFSAETETISHKLIENFMLVANEYVAKTLGKLSPTLMYRIHEDPDPAKIEKMQKLLAHYGIKMPVRENLNKSVQALLDSLPDEDYHIVFDRMILRSMKKAKYSIEHKRHFGLAIEDYTHFTSPIRRLCDLVVHHLIKTYITKVSQDRLSKNQIKYYSEVATEKELLADETEREIEKVYNKAYMKGRIGEEFWGLVIGVSSRGLIIRLSAIPIVGIAMLHSTRQSRWEIWEDEAKAVSVSNGYYYRLLDKVLVKVLDVSDDIYFELSTDPGKHIHKPVSRAQIVSKNAPKSERKYSKGPSTDRNAKGRKK